MARSCSAFSALVAAAAVTLGLAGCGVLPDAEGETTRGELGELGFSYGECLFGCPLDRTWLLGTTEIVTVRDTQAPREDFVATSTDPSVFVVRQQPAPSDRVLTVVTVGPGEASIEIRTTDGSRVIDYTAIRVDVAARLEVRVREEGGPWTTPDTLAIARGGALGVGVVARAASGDELRATLGLEMATSDPSVAALEFSIDKGAIDDLAVGRQLGVVIGASTGEATLLARVTKRPDGLLGGLPVRVVPSDGGDVGVAPLGEPASQSSP